MFNSKNLLVSLLTASISFGMGNWSELIANAEPDPIFNPILSAIGNRRPSGNMVMRLPSVLRLYDYQNKLVTVYPEVQSLRNAGLYITFSTQPKCGSRSCYFGGIRAYKDLGAMKSEDYGKWVYKLLSDQMGRPYLPTQPNRVCGIVSRKIEPLNKSIKAAVVEYDTCGVSSGRYTSVIWQQDTTVFVVQLGDKNSVDVSKSMANESPVTFPIPY
jgi:hypothetical protein